MKIIIRQTNNKETQDRELERALKILKRNSIDLIKELRRRRYYEKPSEKKRREWKEKLRKKNKRKT